MDCQVGQELPSLELRLNRSGIVQYAGASTDFNPIHYSDRKAQAIGLPGVVAHGMWTMGAALRIVTDWIGDPAAVISYSTRFVAPLLVPDDDAGVVMLVTAKITEITDKIATIAIEVTHQDKKLLAATKAQVRL